MAMDGAERSAAAGACRLSRESFSVRLPSGVPTVSRQCGYGAPWTVPHAHTDTAHTHTHTTPKTGTARPHPPSPVRRARCRPAHLIPYLGNARPRPIVRLKATRCAVPLRRAGGAPLGWRIDDRITWGWGEGGRGLFRRKSKRKTKDDRGRSGGIRGNSSGPTKAKYRNYGTMRCNLQRSCKLKLEGQMRIKGPHTWGLLINYWSVYRSFWGLSLSIHRKKSSQ